MAVTAHWIEERRVIHKDMNGKDVIVIRLEMQRELVAFAHAPGHHTGPNLSKLFMEMLDRIEISVHQVCVAASTQA
jgi:hypothetical protein